MRAMNGSRFTAILTDGSVCIERDDAQKLVTAVEQRLEEISVLAVVPGSSERVPTTIRLRTIKRLLEPDSAPNSSILDWFDKDRRVIDFSSYLASR
jgi:hypothetical protein